MIKKSITQNHEFLFIYDAKLCNPNGDPDNENKPRMDEERELNLVSDVRLKRYIRDYLQQYKNKDIYVTKLKDKPAMPNDILKDLKQRIENPKKTDDASFYLQNLIDVRMFGATMAIEKNQLTFTGPIQINWGYSLNPVTLCDSNGITSHFKSNEKATQSTMGKDYRVNYSLIAFYGNIIAQKAVTTLLSEEDIKLFDEALIKSIPLMATRSKIGQYPRFYLRMAYNSPQFLFGDLRKLIKLEINEEAKTNKITYNNIRDISELRLNVNDLVKHINIFTNTKIIDENGDETNNYLLNREKSVFWHNNSLALSENIDFSN